MELNSIGQRVDYLIHEELKIKQREFAHAVGIKDSNVSHIIHDERPVGVGLIKKICTKYDVSAEWLLGLSDRIYSQSEWIEEKTIIDQKRLLIQHKFKCKQCGRTPLRDNEYDIEYHSDYCPFCGCYMRNKEGK